MLYPFKFSPLFKSMLWGGRNLEKLGKNLPEGIVAESWEVSCHPDGISTIANGRFEGITLPELIAQFGRSLVGDALPQKDVDKFPLLAKFIDANDNLSVQVHPDDSYAYVHENGEYGKNEMWYIISAEPGATLIYDIAPGIDKEAFKNAVDTNTIESCLNSVAVTAGDVLNIPAGMVHAIGKGIVLAEIQQNSNTTYRVFDYNRVDKAGTPRPLHIEKALEVIDFNTGGRKVKYPGLKIKLSSGATCQYLVANRYFCVEEYLLGGKLNETADGSRFFIYNIIEGQCKITSDTVTTEMKAGESALIPASLGSYTVEGNAKFLKSYVPDLDRNVIAPLQRAGYSMEDICSNVAGLA